MLSRIVRFAWLAMLVAVGFAPSAAAQTAEAVVAEASRAMGIEGLSSIKIYGSGASFTWSRFSTSRRATSNVTVSPGL